MFARWLESSHSTESEEARFCAVRPNPSLERTSTGKALAGGGRSAQTLACIGRRERMSIFQKLFARTEPSEEDKLLASLKRLSDALRPHDSHWAGILAALHDEAAVEFSSGSPVGRRYQLARKIEQLFGGMGSLNDIAMPRDCQRLHSELFTAVESVLRHYWRGLGRTSHEHRGALLPVGAAVRLIPGKVRYYNRDESPVVVADTPAVRSQTWRIVRHDGPDITNMPSYLLQRDNTFMSARHESLELVRD
jgi:hypothetical protein